MSLIQVLQKEDKKFSFQRVREYNVGNDQRKKRNLRVIRLNKLNFSLLTRVQLLSQILNTRSLKNWWCKSIKVNSSIGSLGYQNQTCQNGQKSWKSLIYRLCWLKTRRKDNKGLWSRPCGGRNRQKITQNCHWHSIKNSNLMIKSYLTQVWNLELNHDYKRYIENLLWNLHNTSMNYKKLLISNHLILKRLEKIWKRKDSGQRGKPNSNKM